MEQKKSPWDYMGPAETAILGDVILNPEEQARWGRAILFGTLPYMWREKASVIREMIYDKLALKPGDQVLIIGECVQVCGFDSDMQGRMNGQGHIDIIDITARARGAYIDGSVGRGGQLATWRWTYTQDTPDNYYDAVAILQSVQHTDDWHESARELTRVLKPGRSIVLAEIALGPKILTAASVDVHIEAWVDKMFSPSPTGNVSTLIWSTDQCPADIDVGEGIEDYGARILGTAPPVHGTRFAVIDFAPHSAGSVHRTDSLDYVIVLSGEIEMQLDQSVVTMQAGDVMVQRGTNHGWTNRTDRTARLAFVLMDANPIGIGHAVSGSHNVR